MTKPWHDYETLIFNEMMSHPALFAHSSPKKIAVIGDEKSGIMKQVLHHKVTKIWRIGKKVPLKDKRIHFQGQNWLEKIPAGSLDVIINDLENGSADHAKLFNLLTADGIMLQLADSPFKLDLLKKHHQQFISAGFSDIQIINFPQPQFETGWRSAFIAKKEGVLRHTREKDIFNKTFPTVYYNHDIHKAALVLPEFLRKKLTL